MIFRVGDRVRVTNRFAQDSYGAQPGETGIIRRTKDECYVEALGIEWDFEKVYFHTCSGVTERNRGYYIYPCNWQNLEIIPRKIGNIGVFR